MNLAEYQTNLENMKSLLTKIHNKGVFAKNATQGAAEVTITSDYFRDSGNYLVYSARRYLRRAAYHEIDVATLELIRLADKCGIDIIDELVENLPIPYRNCSGDLQEKLEDYLEGELK